MKGLLERVFPPVYNNEYNGHKLAFYAFIPITILQLWRSQHHLFAPDSGCQTIASVPLDTFTEAGAAATISFSSVAGLFQLFLALMFLLAILKYRSMIPLMYVFFVTENVMAATYFRLVKPVPTTVTPPAMIVSVPFICIGFLLLYLSIKTPRSTLK